MGSENAIFKVKLQIFSDFSISSDHNKNCLHPWSPLLLGKKSSPPQAQHKKNFFLVNLGSKYEVVESPGNSQFLESGWVKLKKLLNTGRPTTTRPSVQSPDLTHHYISVLSGTKYS